MRCACLFVKFLRVDLLMYHRNVHRLNQLHPFDILLRVVCCHTRMLCSFHLNGGTSTTNDDHWCAPAQEETFALRAEPASHCLENKKCSFHPRSWTDGPGRRLKETRIF